MSAAERVIDFILNRNPLEELLVYYKHPVLSAVRLQTNDNAEWVISFRSPTGAECEEETMEISEETIKHLYVFMPDKSVLVPLEET